jgi:hypothetical protein
MRELYGDPSVTVADHEAAKLWWADPVKAG